MWLSAARVHRNVPFSVTSSTRDHWSSVISCSSAVPPRPALFTSTSIAPSSSVAAANNACTVDFVGHVARHAGDPQLLGGLGQATLVLVGDEDASALLQAPLRDRRTDAGAGGRGDEHRLAGEQAVGGDVGRGVGHVSA